MRKRLDIARGNLDTQAHAPRLRLAGQITGVEGYVESTACGYLTALAVHARRTGTTFAPPPGTTALGALYRHVTGEAHPPGAPYQPTNVVFALFPPVEGRMKKALAQMQALPTVLAPIVKIRKEELK